MASRYWQGTRWRRALGRSPRRRIYPLVGLVLAQGAPGGLILTRALEAGQLPCGRWLLAAVCGDPWGYAFLTLFVSSVALLLGTFLGSQEDRLLRLAVTDPLTGILNRRAFGQRLEEETARSRRYRTPLTLALIDLDGLKRINDGAGHHAGDRAIRAVAAALAQTLRTTDFLARYAGDEFVALLPQTSASQAAGLARRINRAVRQLPHGPQSAPLSVSIGVADLDSAHGQAAAALVQAADAALYAAKAAGRDTVRLAPPMAGGTGLDGTSHAVG